MPLGAERVVIMGVAGCGKSTVGAALAEHFGCDYVDGDDLHPPSNIAKMSSGQPLTDEDRWPWLEAVGDRLAQHDGPSLIGCSALRRVYRDRIRAHAGGPVFFLHLAADQSVIAARMNSRDGHFMPPALLDSQFATLEQLEEDEPGAVVDIDRPLGAVIGAAVQRLTSQS